MGYTGFRIFNTLRFNNEPILASINARPHYYKFFGPVSNGADPFKGHSYGFYSFKNAKLMVHAFSFYTLRSYDAFGHTWAEIEAFGNVIEHEHGWRSQKLMFKNIFIPRHLFSDAQIMMMERRYACEVGFTDDIMKGYHF